MTALAEKFLEGLDGVRKTSNGWEARCLTHDDRKQSLCIGIGREGNLLVTCQAGCPTEDVVAARGWKMADLFPESGNGRGPRIRETYDYVDEGGELLLFQVVRRDGKDFRQRRPNGSGWVWKLGDVRRVLYRLPNVLQAVRKGDRVWIVEGEKDVHALERIGITATCNPGGAGKWRPEYTEALTGARVVLCGDCDKPGRDHVQKVAQALSGSAGEVRVVDLDPEREDGYDVADFLADARTVQDRGQARKVLELAAEKARNVFPPPKSSGVVTRHWNLPFAPMGEALANVPAEPEWVWKGYVAPRTVTLLAARPKTGKTTLLFAGMGRFSEGRTFLDLPTSKAGVLLLSEERQDTLADKQRRFGLNGSVDLLMRHQVERGTSWRQVVEEAVAYCGENGLSVLVVDTFDKWTGLKGDAENSAGAVNEALEPLQRAAAEGLAVVVVTHQRKSHGEFGEAVRGSSALTGGVDIVVELERGGNDLPTGSRVLRAVSRYSSTPEDLVAELVEDTYESRGPLDTAKKSTDIDRIRRALTELDKPTAAEVGEHVEISESKARRLLQDLAEAEEIKRSGAGKAGDPFRFQCLSTTTDPLGGDETFPQPLELGEAT